MRPVLMTSLTIILSLLPAALGIGAGSDTNGPLAVAVIGVVVH
jgi:HAE1 family hydrophobic/amphiphilic exporter-1